VLPGSSRVSRLDKQKQKPKDEADGEGNGSRVEAGWNGGETLESEAGQWRMERGGRGILRRAIWAESETSSGDGEMF
jgi:hypothetical protein